MAETEITRPRAALDTENDASKDFSHEIVVQKDGVMCRVGEVSGRAGIECVRYGLGEGSNDGWGRSRWEANPFNQWEERGGWKPLVIHGNGSSEF